MSFLSQLQKQKNKLKETETVVTKVDGKRYIEKDTTVTAISSNSYGFVVDTKPDNVPVLISHYLYIGSQDCTAQEVIQSYNILHVLSLGINIQVSVNSKFIKCLDLPETSIKDILLDSLPFIRKAVDAKENILIHCNAGVSRTSMVAIAYLMHYEKMNYQEAYELVKAKRPAIQPNDGFKKQLKSMTPGEII
ncbi:dual specificity protein phosphatase 19-like [Spodoptera litura]|uniref:Dual specificity protein phosphatase 19-like n=1 Tax=Spodoptera litura TaxID=69820 RepID=A0A9J7ING9_SPOLT|nr:dual specificity protein phosphatase 19-like [Spodoptera litura]